MIPVKKHYSNLSKKHYSDLGKKNITITCQKINDDPSDDPNHINIDIQKEKEWKIHTDFSKTGSANTIPVTKE